MAHGDIAQLSDRGHLWRLLASLIVGAVCALLLTWFMYELIHSTQQRLDESKRAHMLDFVRLRRDESSAKKQARPTRPVQPDAPSAPAAPKADSSSAEATLAVSALPDGSGVELKIGGLGFGGSDGEYLPIVKVAPIYPQRAMSAGIEGECVVKYTVTSTGSTRDVVVIEDMCVHGSFHRPSIQAAEKFKYKPRIIDGEAVEVHDVYNRFIFSLKKQ